MEVKTKIIILAIASVIFTIWFGFGSTESKIRSCVSTVSRYVTAEFSEVTVDICFNADGSAYTCTDTDYWSEPASDTVSITTVNGEPQTSVGNSAVSHGAYYPPMPSKDHSMRNMRDFDNFQEHTDTKLTIHLYGTETDSFSEPINKNNACIAKLDMRVEVSTWYGTTYSSDF